MAQVRRGGASARGSGDCGARAAGGAGISVSVADRTVSSGDFGVSTGHSDHAPWIETDSTSAIHSVRRARGTGPVPR